MLRLFNAVDETDVLSPQLTVRFPTYKPGPKFSSSTPHNATIWNKAGALRCLV